MSDQIILITLHSVQQTLFIFEQVAMWIIKNVEIISERY